MQYLSLGSLDKRDIEKYYVENPVDFNPRKNEAIINETLANTEKYFENVKAPIDNAIGERLDIMAHYAVYKFGAQQGSKTIRQYLGEPLYKQIVGEKIIEKMRIMKTVNKLSGNRNLNQLLI